MFLLRLLMGLLLVWGISHLVESYHSSQAPEEASTAPHQERAPKELVLAGVKLGFSWHPLGFEDLKLGDLTIANSTGYWLREVKVTCEKRAGKSARTVSASRVLPEAVKPHSTSTFKEFSVGFVGGPDEAGSCRIADLVATEGSSSNRPETSAQRQGMSDLAWARVQSWLAGVMGEVFRNAGSAGRAQP
jgi:hypothetical protein